MNLLPCINDFEIPDEAAWAIHYYGKKAIALEGEVGPLRQRAAELAIRNGFLERQNRHLIRELARLQGCATEQQT